MKRDPLEDCTGFEWDEGNLDKNWQRHGVAFWECEEIVLNRPLVVRPDSEHSKTELRYYALGRTEAGRLLFVAFTIRRKLIRPISARDMTAKERRVYAFYSKEDSEVQ
ncbi:MAG TPA: BrnT family toxin [Thermoanaerobaculia bacterium]|nr:BrnT family toxin [Thermoanaerobaculia bacterium]